MKCPKCKTTLSTKHYDAEYELYECPKCEGAFTPDEIEEATSGTSPAKRSRAAGKSNKPVAKAKEHKSEIAEDDEAIAKFEAETLKPRESSGPKITKHRDEVETKAVKEIIADEVQEIGYEFGVEIDRLNAVEWYAHNLWLSLHAMNGISARDKKVPMVKCGEHA